MALTLALAMACRGDRPLDSFRRGEGQEGLASWYGPGFHGRQTANGERFDMHGRTAAHRTLPFGTRVRVVRLDDGRSVTVRINDRGPFVRGRIIDLSLGAAKKIGLNRDGVARVTLSVERWPEDMAPAVFAVQVGAFREQGNAQRLQERLERGWDHVHIVEYYDFYRVRVGAYTTEEAAQQASRRLAGELEDLGLVPFVTRDN